MAGIGGSYRKKGCWSSIVLPLVDRAFLSGHAEFGLRGTTAFLAASSIHESGFVPKLAAFTGFKSSVKGFFVGQLEPIFRPFNCRTG